MEVSSGYQVGKQPSSPTEPSHQPVFLIFSQDREDQKDSIHIQLNEALSLMLLTLRAQMWHYRRRGDFSIYSTRRTTVALTTWSPSLSWAVLGLVTHASLSFVGSGVN